MCFKGKLSINIKLLLLILSCQGMSVYAQDNISYSNKEDSATAELIDNKLVNKTDLQDKYYRQALYHYFQDDHGQALSQIEQSKAKLQHLDSRTSLFEAGLQLSEGLLQQARKTLVNFDELLIAEQNNKISDSKLAKANELLLISLLSLTDQYLAQGDIYQARDTLARIKFVSATYYPQYHVLSQLAYWPNDTVLLPIEPASSEYISSPYILLNDALRLIEKSRSEQSAAVQSKSVKSKGDKSRNGELINGQTSYQQAISLLTTIKSTRWQEKSPDFWKTLFLNEESFVSQSDEQKMQISQGQAIQDYAQLLLAQIYISQQRYKLAFKELESFPQHSPYTESALFLFAFASQEVSQYDIAFNLLTLLHQNYPHSTLGWQSAELMAEQVSNQRSFAQGLSAYQNVENFFLHLQRDLSDFDKAFFAQGNLLEFRPLKATSLEAMPVKGVSTQKTTSKGFQTESIWLQQALYDAELANLYQGLTSIDEQTKQVQLLLNKATWLAEIIALNQQRKTHIVSTNKAINYPVLFAQLSGERDRLARILNQQTQNDDHTIFANEEERQWLERIKESYSILKAIDGKKDIEDYQQRLLRVQGVLSWQLAQKNPQRMWSHKKQLQSIDNAIVGVTQQQKKLEEISGKDDSLSTQINKNQQSIKQLKLQLKQAAKLREKFTVKIRAKVNAYIDEQDILLAEHLLSTRQGMAKVLERMARADKKLSRQLMPESDLKAWVKPQIKPKVERELTPKLIATNDNVADMAGNY